MEAGSAAKHYSVFDSRYWWAYWITARPYLFFVSAAASLPGLALAEWMWVQKFSLMFLAFFLTYGLGQALTDVFQTDTDSLSSPYRPLTQGLITKKQVLWTSLIGLAFCGAVFTYFNPWNLPLSVLAVLGLVAYTPFKRRWWAGPAWNSGVVAILPLIGFCSGTRAKFALDYIPLYLATGSVFFSYAVFVLLGYFKDISADRATGYQTMPVVAGWRPSVLASLGYAAGAIYCSASLLLSTELFTGLVLGFRWLPAALWVLAVYFLLLAHHRMWGMWRTQDEKAAHIPIAHCVRAFVLLHVAEAAAIKPELLWPGVAFYGLFELTLALRPEPTQI